MSISGEYFVTDKKQKRFFRNPQFHSFLQEYIKERLSVDIEINVIYEPVKYWHQDKIRTYKIKLVQTHMEKQVFAFIKKYLNEIQSRKYSNIKDFKWLSWFLLRRTFWKFLTQLINKRVPDRFTIIKIECDSLNLSYLCKDLVNDDQLDYFLKYEVIQEIIPLPLRYECSPQLKIELNELKNETNDDNDIAIILNGLTIRRQLNEIILFGYQPKIIELKNKFLEIIERNILITYKLSSIDQFSIQHSWDMYVRGQREIENNYKQFAVKIRLYFNEFSAPKHLKDEIEILIKQLLSRLSSTITRTFQTMPLYQIIAENEEKYLKMMTNNHCRIQTCFQSIAQFYSIPKALSSNSETSKIILQQSKRFLSSSNVFKKINIANGFIELRTGDIALQDVHTIIISTTFNGLKESLIDRARPFDYEKTHIHSNGIMYTETDGGQLKCKRILFSNWTPIFMANNDKILRKSIQSFISNSLAYIQDAPSISFAVPDLSINEMILAEEMIAEVKQQLEQNQFEQRISFVLLPEQKSLYDQFARLIETSSTIYAYFDWPMTVIEITLMGSDEEIINRCQNNMTKYLSRCSTSSKLTHSNGIFHCWNQHAINSFYKYCKDQCILLKYNQIENILEFIGPIYGIEAVKKKWYILNELMKYTSIIEHRNSVMHRSRTKLYNIMLSYSPKDNRQCQRLINRLTEEGFSLGFNLYNNIKTRNIPSEINKCDCIILCISENYYENLSCLEEAKYALQTNQSVFLVKLQNCPVFGWDYDLFEGKLFFQLFGSEQFFDFESERLLIQLFRCTKPGFTPLLVRRSNFIQQTTNDFGKITNTERNQKNNISQKSNDTSRQLTLLEQQWLQKLTNVSQTRSWYWDNDHKVCIDMLPNNNKISDTSILCNSSLYHIGLSSYFHTPYSFGFDPLSHASKNLSIISAVMNKEQIYGKVIEIQAFTGLSQENSLNDFIPRRNHTYYSYPLLIKENRSEEEMKQRQRLDNPNTMKYRREQLTQYFMNKYRYYTQEQWNLYSTFAQRMRNNTLTFEKFCSTNTRSLIMIIYLTNLLSNEKKSNCIYIIFEIFN